MGFHAAPDIECERVHLEFMKRILAILYGLYLWVYDQTVQNVPDQSCAE